MSEFKAFVRRDLPVFVVIAVVALTIGAAWGLSVHRVHPFTTATVTNSVVSYTGAGGAKYYQVTFQTGDSASHTQYVACSYFLAGMQIHISWQESSGSYVITDAPPGC